jgi:geranylgeranyl diphosphate synthase, type II
MKYNKIQELYSYLRDTIESRISILLKDDNKAPIYAPCKYILASGGKRIRGVLTLLTCKATGGKVNNCINSAAAIEILHLFTLVHDDIMDNADKRRGLLTIHKKWDTSTAILTGDILIGLAYNLLLKTRTNRIEEIVNTFTDAIIEVCEGQAFDKEFETKDAISLPEYYLMIDKKTGKLIENAVIIGGLFGNTNKRELKDLKRYGSLVGRAFQIKDDLLDIVGSENELGKPVLSDIRESKKTYLYTQAYNLFSKEDFIRLKKLYLSRCKTTKDLTQILELYNKYNLIEEALSEIQKIIVEAKRFLRNFPINRRKPLEDFADLLEIRKS